jgi:hypothetical protein
VSIGVPQNQLPSDRVPTPIAPSLPPWEQAAGNFFTWGSPGAAAAVQYGIIGDEGLLNRMMLRLVELWVVNPADVDTGVAGNPNKPGRRTMTAKDTLDDWAGYEQFHIRDTGRFVQAWWAYWCRVDHDVADWPSGFEMGMSTNGTSVRVSRRMYERLRAGQMWTDDPGESQTFFTSDWMFKGLLASRLRQMGYLSSADMNISTAEGGAMWNALHNYVAEMLALPEATVKVFWPRANIAQGVPWAFTWGQKRQSEGYWTRDNDQIVIQLSVVKSIIDGVSARTAAAASGTIAAFRNATVRPPIVGLPSDGKRSVFLRPGVATTLVARPAMLATLAAALKGSVT